MTGFNSKRCPISAEIVRAYREVFGDDVKVVEVHEAGFHHPTIVVKMQKPKESDNERGPQQELTHSNA